ncbi:unnamed protein product [Cylicocyclus nassatus]|uniref:Uncharacterized protein n=1 Tax=Cylicocyclus nassatus TaxID=53992 RepID=A0AA36GL22_CYLNA|nr:unnamed protein product [Cylicocyclus nassatus]
MVQIWIYAFVLSQLPHGVLQEEVKVKHPSHVLPYKLLESYRYKEMSVRGYMSERPVFGVAYGSLTDDVYMYLSPSSHCQAVWLCYGGKPNTTAEIFFELDWDAICGDSTRFHPLEQTVYVVQNGEVKAHPYYSSLVELQYDSINKKVYIFKSQEGFQIEDVATTSRPEIVLDLSGKFVFLLTSSPYCFSGLHQPFGGIVKGYTLNLTADDWKEYYDFHYFRAGGDKNQKKISRKGENRTESFDSVKRRKGLRKAEVDCCPPTWEFEGFLSANEWNEGPYVAYHRYKLFKQGDAKCKEATSLQSILIEIGDECEWMRLCFDNNPNQFCEDDANTLSLIFNHEVYIPTDSENARAFAIPFEDLKVIRINFIVGYPGIEMAYGFSSPTTPAVMDLMRLNNYDGKDPSKITINVIKASWYCQARLTNDLGSMNPREGGKDGAEYQCLSIQSCTCMKP